MTEGAMEAEKAEASAWFGTLRDRIVAAVEALEDEPAAGAGDRAPGRFVFRETRRAAPDGEDAGGGVMALLKEGRVVEKMGVGVSTVHGVLSPAAREAMRARGVLAPEDGGTFWASGISLVCHPRNPHVPAVHLNTRMFWTSTNWWFGGGTDLNPAIPYEEDTRHFHAVLERALAPHGADEYRRQKEWADRYFFIPHRGRPRGVGGIFLDDHCSGDWQADFAMIRAIGEAFLPAWLPLARRRAAQTWTDADREAQLLHRGLYAEFNLVYDRGTRFGLASGHDADAVLMSLPPLAAWA
ncbi:oxygen-dependent coproporphyrinogen oxidase [Rubellimicrobium sp. CFH 75288]|uniref:oxygen-dependent coproporphyrinogen oxidase n=1 Tax=Rubellimicrobium sp. CFH 75288 TaxID=2697034 RepID=UPI001412E0DD|nr:oxygen-dependent coproporphyrinogen oxidase [Rubellimicrobium sp. CFH 75288]NAZ37922.1 oxygen-dependent coproporphyrinogen oxidase [Rubellimicrobium sp. CFH 75288]